MKKVISTLAITLLVAGFATTPVVANNRVDVSLGANANVEFKHDFQKQIDKKIEKGKEIPYGIEKKISTSGGKDDDREDAKKPRLFNIMVVDRTETSARVIWITPERADSKVWVSTSKSGDTGAAPQASSAELNFLHNMALTNLTPDTKYFFIVASTDASGNTAQSEVKSFTTKTTSTTPDATAPRITAIRIANITAVGATLGWTTNEGTTGRVVVSTSSSIVESGSKIFTATEFKESQKIALTQLAANTKYYYRIEVTDRSGNKTQSEIKSFTTLAVDTTLPTIWGPLIIRVSDTSARIIWLTNERTDGKVWVTTAATVGTSGAATKSSEGNGFFHSVTVTGLTADTVYHFVVGSADASGNLILSTTGSFTTSE